MDEYYNQNPIKKFIKERSDIVQARERASIRAAVQKARLLDDDEIRERMGAAHAPTAKDKYGNTAVSEREAKGKSAEELAAAALEEDDDEKDRETILQAGGARKYALAGGANTAALSAMADEEEEGNIARPLDLDKLGVDPMFFGMRKPPPSYAPVGKDRLKAILAAGYARAQSKAFAAERGTNFETGIGVQYDDGHDVKSTPVLRGAGSAADLARQASFNVPAAALSSASSFRLANNQQAQQQQQGQEATGIALRRSGSSRNIDEAIALVAERQLLEEKASFRASSGKKPTVSFKSAEAYAADVADFERKMAAKRRQIEENEDSQRFAHDRGASSSAHVQRRGPTGTAATATSDTASRRLPASSATGTAGIRAAGASARTLAAGPAPIATPRLAGQPPLPVRRLA